MRGFVDDKLRALVRVPVAASSGGKRMDIAVWIDTAFNGGLVIPRKQIRWIFLSVDSARPRCGVEFRFDDRLLLSFP